MSFGDVDVVSLHAWQVKVAEYRVEDQPAAGRARADEHGCGGVSVKETSDGVCWPRGARRGEDLAAPGYLTVREKDSVVRDACSWTVVNSQPLAVVYWGHGGKEVFPSIVGLGVGECDPYRSQGLYICKIGPALGISNDVSVFRSRRWRVGPYGFLRHAIE